VQNFEDVFTAKQKIFFFKENFMSDNVQANGQNSLEFNLNIQYQKYKVETSHKYLKKKIVELILVYIKKRSLI
jgi:hypothetical protein